MNCRISLQQQGNAADYLSRLLRQIAVTFATTVCYGGLFRLFQQWADCDHGDARHDEHDADALHRADGLTQDEEGKAQRERCFADADERGSEG